MDYRKTIVVFFREENVLNVFDIYAIDDVFFLRVIFSA